MRVYIYYLGKPRYPNANRMAADYVQRVSRYARIEMREARAGRSDPRAKHPAARLVGLDPAGQAVDSRAFTALVARAETEARDLVFLIGGADGLPGSWREPCDVLVSLSPMTLPHELARVLLAEQIYRAFAQLRGHPYPR